LSIRRIRAGRIAAAATLLLNACGDDSIPLSALAGYELDGTTGGEAVVLPGAPGAPEIATGSPGGATIIQYVAKTLIVRRSRRRETNRPSKYHH
jgi:hypothetical protein